MKYTRVYLESIGYELAPVVVSSAEIERRLAPVYKALHLSPGQLEALTGIKERRWWNTNFRVSQGATLAARKALAASDLTPNDIDVLIYAGVCRENHEPATACRVAADLKVNPDAAVFDVSNACLGVLNGIIEVANRIELGQAKAGLVVSCETAREINEAMIDRMVQQKSMESFRDAVATLTGGSGAVAVLVVGEELSSKKRRQLLGGVNKNAPQHHALCKWGWESLMPMVEKVVSLDPSGMLKIGYDLGIKHCVRPFMSTDAGAVLKFGVDLGLRTWRAFLTKFGWGVDQLDKVICHQVGGGHRDAILRALDIPPEKDFTTYQYLGNIGTVSLPMTAAMAEERNFLMPGDQVGFLGIGSGLNCLMLGLKW